MQWHQELPGYRFRESLLYLTWLAGGIVLGAHWPYLIELLAVHSAKDLLDRVPALALALALIGLVVQIARSRFNLEIDLALKMDDRWESEFMRQHRGAAARALQAGIKEENDDVDATLDFLEALGFLVRRRAINARTAWQLFSPLVFGYEAATKEYRRDMANETPETWAEFEYLYDALWDQELRSCKEQGMRPKRYDDKKTKKFLESEARFASAPDSVQAAK